MTKQNARLWVVATLTSIAIFAIGISWGSDAAYALSLPGRLIAWPVWPEGLHTRPGGVSALGFLLVVAVGNLAVWAVVFRLVLGALFRNHHESRVSR